MKRLIHWAIGALSAALLIILGPSPANAQSYCYLEFSDHFALSNLFAQARGQFAEWTHFDAQNRKSLCKSQDPWSDGCWMYRQPCGPGYLNVEASAYSNTRSHLHMDFLDSSIGPQCTCHPSADLWMNLIDPNNNYSVGYGRCPRGSPCPNWGSEPRVGVHPHQSQDSIDFHMDDWAPFDMVDVVITGDRTAVATAYDGEQMRVIGPLAPGWNLINASNVVDVVIFDYNFFYYGERDQSPVGVSESYINYPGGQLDLAFGMQAFQSSTLGGGAATRAVDGGEDGNWYDGSVTHTNYENQPWWVVDLGASQRIGRIDIFNRTDCCSDRLGDYDVQLFEDLANPNPEALHVVDVGAQQETVNFYGLRARFVKIKLRKPNYLSLAEVKVYAGPPPY